MENKNLKQQYEIGMVGLGVMGRNLLLNMADHGFSVMVKRIIIKKSLS